MQVLGERLEDLADFDFGRVFTVGRREVDSDLGVGVNGMELDLLYARRIVTRSLLAELSSARLDTAIGLVDVVVEESGGTVVLGGNAASC